MEVKLITNTPLSVMVNAGRTCWESHSKGGCYIHPTDDINDIDREFLNRIVNKHKHGSVSEHVNYVFSIKGITRACLQELARHRHASLSVKSTRYTLKELKNEDEFVNVYSLASYLSEQAKRVRKYIALVGDYKDKYFPNVDPKDVVSIDNKSIDALNNLRKSIIDGVSNDIAKYSLPESYKTSLIWTVNARSLKNFLTLRSSSHALWEIRELSSMIKESLPEKHKFLFEVEDVE